MATFSQQINATANDGADFNASSYINDGVGVGVGYTSGLRFTGVGIPNGATITSATLKIYSNNDGGANSVTGVITGVTGDCPVMGNPNFPSTRPQTSASVALITGNTLTLRTHDVTTIVQEIVNGTWASGNAMGFIFKQTGGSGTQWYQDYIQSTTQCGLLEITYASPYPELIGAPVAGTASQSATSVNISSLTANGRYGIIAVMTANQTLSAPSGWVERVPASGSPFRGTAGAAGGVRLTLFERQLDGTETTVSIGDSGDIQYPVAFVFAGQGGASVAVDASIGGNAAASTSGTFSGPTSAVDNCLFAYFVATDRDSAAASWSSNANSTIGNSTERYDLGTATGTGGGIALFTSEKATAGAGGNTTATQAASAAYVWITLALKNASSVPSANPDNNSYSHTSTSPSIAANSVVTPNASAWGHSSTSPSLAAKSAVAPDASTYGHSSTSPLLAARSAVSPDDSVHAHGSTSPSISIPGVSVSPADSLYGHASTEPTLFAFSSITPDASAYGHISTSPTIAAKSVLTPEGSLHVHGSTSPALAAHSAVLPNGSTHGHISTVPTIAARSILTPDGSMHAHTSTGPSLAAHSALTPNDSLHGHLSTEPDLLARSSIAADDSYHLHFSSEPAVDPHQPGNGFYVGRIAPADYFAGSLTAADFYVGKGSFF